MSDTTEDVGVRLIVNGQEIFSSKIDKGSASLAKFRAEVAKNQAQVKMHAKDMDAMEQSISNFGRNVAGVFSQAGSSVENFVSPLQSGLRAATSLAATAATGLGYTTVALTAAAGAASYFGLKTYSGLEQANNAFTNFLGSADKAQAFMGQLKTMAANTPFDFVNLVPQAQRLLNSGDSPDKALKDLTAIGDAASGADPIEGQAGVDRIALAIAQIRQSPHLGGQELMQLRNANIDGLKYISQASGKSVQQVYSDQQSQKIGGSWAADAILQGMEKQYGGLMQQQSKTLAGQVSNLHDVVSFQLADANKPLAELLERNMPSITKGLGQLAHEYGHLLGIVIHDGEVLAAAWKMGGADQVVRSLASMTGGGENVLTFWNHLKTDSRDIASVWSQSLWPAIQDVEHALGPLAGGSFKMLEGTLHWMADHPDAAKTIFEGMGIAFSAYKITTLVWGLTTAFGDLILKLPLVQTQMYATAAASDTMAASGSFGGMGLGKNLARGAAIGGGALLAYDGASAKNFGTTDGLKTIGGSALTGAGIGSIVPGVGTALGGIVGGGIGAGVSLYRMHKLPGQASGGRTIFGGDSIVGERGPEILSMRPGATVIPLDSRGNDGGGFGQVNFHEGSIVINAEGADSYELADKLVGALRDKMARR